MNSKHAKSPCCGSGVRGYGARRRQCVKCGHTWTVRPKKRGRPRHRLAPAVLKRVLLDGVTLGRLYAHRSEIALPAHRYRFRQALQRWVARPSPQHIAEGPLILLADGLWFDFGGAPWVLYLIALRPCNGTTATFLDPVLLPGREGATLWVKAIAAIPAPVQARICAVVVDNLRGLQHIAARRRWVLQLCHFHLLLKLLAQRGRVRYRLRGGSVREEIHGLIRSALEMPEGPRLDGMLERLRLLSKGDCGTERTQAMLREFLNDVRYYRTYMRRPELQLPKTTNSVESMCSLLRDLLRKSRAGSNPASVQLWATALIRLRPTVTCNPANQQNFLTHPQFVTLKTGRGQHRKYAPLAFTEHGAIMAATILNCPRAVQMTVFVVRAFVRARELTSSHAQLAKELDALKKSVAELDTDTRRQFDVVHEAILGLMRPPNARQ